MRKAFGVVLYVGAGLFFSTASFMAFTRTSPPGAKFLLLGFNGVPALGLLLWGLRASRSTNWKRHTGIVLLSGASSAAIMALNVACMAATPELGEMFPEKPWQKFSDYASGFSCILLLGLFGALLIWAGRRDQSSGRVSN